MIVLKITNRICANLKLGPNGSHPFRTLGIGQRPFLDSPFSSHLRDLETFRRKAPPLAAIQAPNTNAAAVHSTTNGLMSSDCQGYKPNAPQIQGKLSILCEMLPSFSLSFSQFSAGFAHFHRIFSLASSVAHSKHTNYVKYAKLRT